MATRNLTITLKDEQLQEIRARVAAGQVANASAFVQHAVGIALSDTASWREILQEALEKTGGPLTKKERDWADKILLPARRLSPRKRNAV